MDLSALFQVLTSPPGTLMYQVLVLVSLVATLGILWSEWRRLRADEPRMRMRAVAGAVAGRVAVVALALIWPAVAPPLLRAAELLTMVLLGWGFSRLALTRRGRLVFWLMCGGWVLLTAFSVGAWRRWGGAGGPAAILVPLWQSAMVLAGAGGGLATLRRRGQGALSYLPVVFFLLALGALMGLLAAPILGSPLSAGEGGARLVTLVAYPLLFVALYDAALQETETYRTELRSLSNESLRQTEQLLFLIEATRFIGEDVDLRRMLGDVVRNVVMALRADAALIVLAQEAPRPQVQVAARFEMLDRKARLPGELPLSDLPLIAEVFRTRRQRVVAVDGLTEDGRSLVPLIGDRNRGSVLLQPLSHKDQTLGVLAIYHGGASGGFPDGHAQLAATMGVHIASAIENARLYQALQAKANDLARLLRVREAELQRETAILESMAEGIVVFDAGERFTVINRAAEQILGIERDEILGKTAVETLLTPALWTELSPGLVASASGTFETTFTFGGRRIRVHAAPVMDGGRLAGTVSVLQDVTREYLAEEAKREFITSISHALRTPLTAIKGYTEVMVGGMAGDIPPVLDQLLRSIRENTTRMTSLTNNIISVAEMDRGSLDLTYQAVDVLELSESVAAHYGEQLHARQLTLAIEAQPQLPPIEADPNRLRIVLDNLLSNAAKYGASGTTVRIQLSPITGTDGTPAFLAIAVRDQGAGIPSAEQLRIWERFYRIQAPQSVESDGLGIGLTITKALVEAHGGRVWVDSAPGQGSTFTVLLPVHRAQRIDERLKQLREGQL